MKPLTNIEKLKNLDILGNIRQRVGAKNENDDSFDDYINSMDNSELIENWCGWFLGDGSWWIKMKTMFDDLNEMDNKNH